VLLGVHAALLAYAAVRASPTYDEVGHLPAGLGAWEQGRFDLYQVNPPLVRLVASLAALPIAPEIDWGRYAHAPFQTDRPEFQIGRDWLAERGREVVRTLTVARWACIPFSLIGGLVCFFWARQLYGERAGLVALALWCFEPTVLGHGQLITPDVGAAAMGAWAGYAFWRWLRAPGWGAALEAGVVLALAELTKTTWIILFPLWPTLWLLDRFWATVGKPGGQSHFRGPPDDALTRPSRVGRENRDSPREGQGCPRGWLAQAGQMAAILLVGLFFLNAGYAFEGSFQRLGNYESAQELFGGPKPVAGTGRHHLAGAWLADLPVPLPRAYVVGIEAQKRDLAGGMWSYLDGQWRTTGWWYWYLRALMIKVPLGVWGLLALAIVATLLRWGYSAAWRDEIVLVAPALAVLVLVSAHTGMTQHMRYVLPAYPFALVWASKVARAAQLGHRRVLAVAAAALVCGIGSSVWAYPHSLSYFNELVGGPKGGPAHLLDSNIDWGQDLQYLRRWLDAHPEAQPLGLSFHGAYDAHAVGIDHTAPPPGPPATHLPQAQTGPLPGWYALSVTEIRRPGGYYGYFLRFEPVAMAGYSIWMYHIALEEANRVRGELGLSDLPGDGP
jgi:hypothetical protein